MFKQLTDYDLNLIADHYNEIGDKYAHTGNSTLRIKYKAALDEIYEMLCLLRILNRFTVVNSTPPFMKVNK